MRMIALRSQVAAALDPEQLATIDLEITPKAAALCLLSSRPSLWEAHALPVAFAMDTVGADLPRIAERLASRERLSTWFNDSDFVRYCERQQVKTSQPGLIRAAEYIESGLDPEALREAQLGIIQFDYCTKQCGEDPHCLAQCILK
jgi:hypothetical protein